MKIEQTKDFGPSKTHADLSTGEVIAMLRELKGWTQSELASHSGISSTNLSLLENDKVNIGKKKSGTACQSVWRSPRHYYVPGIRAGEIRKAA